MKIDKQSLSTFRKDFQNSIKELETKYGVKIGLGNISYTQSEFHTKLLVLVNNSNSDKSINEIKVETEFLQYSELLGMKKEYLGKTFVDGNYTYKIVGCKMSSRKYPIIVERLVDKKQFKYPVDLVKLFLK